MSDNDFDFSFENFRPMGFQYTGVVTSSRIEQPEKDTFSFIDKRTGQEVTRRAKTQLVLTIEPTDHVTKSGNPYKEFLGLTQNIRSKLGIFVEHLNQLGIKLGTDPSKLEGQEFEWELKEVDFGGAEPVRINVPIRRLDALSHNGASPAATKSGVKLSDEDKADLADILDGRDASSALEAVMASQYAKNPRIIAAVVDRSLVKVLIDEGYLTMDGSTYAAAVA